MAKEIKFQGTELDANTQRAIATNVLIEGQRPLLWWRRQANDLHNKFMREIRTSLENGESTAQAAVRLTGGTVNGVEVSGILKTTKNNANTLARTALNKITNEARIQSFEANADVVKAMKQISTLDNKTSNICIAYDGQVWANTPGKEPIPPSTLPFNGGPPRHFNCRSTLVPVLKSWEELGIDAKELSASTRASMDGQVPEDTTFDDFLKKKGTTFQNKILGVTKAKLWRAGKITLRQLVDFRGNPLTDEQLLALAQKKRAVTRAATRTDEQLLALAQKKRAVTRAATRTAAGTTTKKPAKFGVEGEPATAKPWQATSWDDSPGYVRTTIADTAPLKEVTGKKGGAYFKPGSSAVNMDADMRPRQLRDRSTWRHEYGHHLDREFARQLSDGARKKGRNHVSAQGDFLKAFAADTRSVNKGAGGRTPSVAFENSSSAFQKHVKGAQSGGTEYLNNQFKKHGLTYRGMRDLHRKHMDATVDSPNDVIMRNKMAMLLAAIDTGNAQFYINQVWETAQYFKSGISGHISDYYGAITQNRVGYGHSAGYYKVGMHKRTTEAFANATTMIGAESGWAKVIRALGHDKFFNQVDDILKNGGKI
jgi:SPP1 gp7 family putative phage head morphogenesis protein